MPIRIRMPSRITKQFPIAKVTVCNLGESRLCVKPLKNASKVCQESDAEKAPTTKRSMSIGDAVVPAVNPSMSVVKYATVTGLRRVRPKNMQYVSLWPNVLTALSCSFRTRNPL